jgi:16S rRNA (uracil1498-N3)-methyltransferase
MRDYRHFLFFSDRVEADRLYLDASETRHAVAALRREKGDLLLATDGQGTIYECRIEAIDKRELTGLIVGRTLVPRHPCSIHLLVGVPERDAFEKLVTDLAALGVARITPLVCRYCQGNWWERGADGERLSLRLRNKMVAAVKQSLYPYLPRLDPPLLFGEIVTAVSGSCMVADPEGIHFSAALDAIKHQPLSYTGIVGPPGGFAPEESAALKERGATGVRLAPTRLTTELAAVALCSGILVCGSTDALPAPFPGAAA